MEDLWLLIERVCGIFLWESLSIFKSAGFMGVFCRFAIVRHPEGVLPKCKMRPWVALVCVTFTSSGWVGAILRPMTSPVTRLPNGKGGEQI